jgi:hypothetical protein
MPKLTNIYPMPQEPIETPESRLEVAVAKLVAAFSTETLTFREREESRAEAVKAVYVFCDQKVAEISAHRHQDLVQDIAHGLEK